MPVTITLKNIPDSVYQSLKQSAEANRRSLNMEAITVLEKALAPKPAVSVEERIARIRRLSESMPVITVVDDPADLIRKDRDERNARDRTRVEATGTNQRPTPPKRKGERA